MAELIKKQEMPPSGGYKSIQFKRIPAKSYFNGWALIGGYLGMTAGAAYVFYLTEKVIQRDEIEQRSAQFALYPMLLAERDRAYLKQLRKNRDEEAKLMANVEGWKVGTYYGEKLYTSTSVPDDTLLHPRLQEYFVHTRPEIMRKRLFFSMWH